MNDINEPDFEMTLDPPGRIAVIGAGPLGIEAALYGRFLGYDVTVYEKAGVGQSLLDRSDEPLPMLPDRTLSPLAISALKAHDGGLAAPSDPAYPLTISQWVNGSLARIAATDLLTGRVMTGAEVIKIETCEIQSDDDVSDDDETYIDGDVPADYRLTVRVGDDVQTGIVEAVIIATGQSSDDGIEGLKVLEGSPYLYPVGKRHFDSEEATLHHGWSDIVNAYARMGGRKGLDLYRPIRS